MATLVLDFYEAIKEDILRMRFRTDEIINEKALAERYNVSKTPVREALAILVQEGYLRKRFISTRLCPWFSGGAELSLMPSGTAYPAAQEGEDSEVSS